MDELYDMHCHLDFAEESEKVAAAADEAGIRALSCTVVPSSYVSDREKFQGHHNIALSLGMHPWWVADGRVSEVDIARFESLLPEAAFVGEVGLDLAASRKQTKVRQLEVLERILSDVHEVGDGRVITFHAVHAATELMDMLSRLGTLAGNICIFHWFQGSHEEFGRAVASGAFLSVGVRMMGTERGSLFAAAIPDEQLLVETDAPAHEGSAWDVGMWRQEIQNAIKGLAQLRGCSAERIARIAAENAERVLNAPAL